MGRTLARNGGRVGLFGRQRHAACSTFSIYKLCPGPPSTQPATSAYLEIPYNDTQASAADHTT